jgi:hypothetical protein
MHVGGQTTSDVAVWVATPGGRRRLVSFFDTMTDALFAVYQARGAASRAEFILGAEARNAENASGAVSCDATGSYSRPGALPAWVMLRGP